MQVKFFLANDMGLNLLCKQPNRTNLVVMTWVGFPKLRSLKQMKFGITSINYL